MTTNKKADSGTSMAVSAVSPKRLVIVGATGMVGGYALRFALDKLAVKSVTSIGRKKLGITHPKLTEVLHQNFADCSALADVLSAQDAVVYCLGTYTGSVSDEQLRLITADYTIEFARVFRGRSPNAAFSFLSGNGADPSGRSRLAFARYKGQAEKALLEAGFPYVCIFRPAYIYPVEPRKEPNLSYRLMRAIYPAFRALFPNQVIRADGPGPGHGARRNQRNRRAPKPGFREPRHPGDGRFASASTGVRLCAVAPSRWWFSRIEPPPPSAFRAWHHHRIVAFLVGQMMDRLERRPASVRKSSADLTPQKPD